MRWMLCKETVNYMGGKLSAQVWFGYCPTHWSYKPPSKDVCRTNLYNKKCDTNANYW